MAGVVGHAAGRGRFVRQKMFHTTNLYRASLPVTKLNNLSINYFWGPPAPAGPSTNQNWPWTVTQINFQYDPFATGTLPAYQDVSIRMQTLDTARGRQYELDTITAGESSVGMVDPDEALNPTNTSSPYYPGIKVYRRILDQAMWPPTAAQVAAIQLNNNSTFEATASPWVGVNNATVARSTALSHSGIASLLTTPDGVTSNPTCSTEMIAAYPNVNYTLNLWLATPAGSNPVRHAQIVWYDVNQALITQSDIAVTLTGANTWYNANGTFLSPTNTRYMQINVVGFGAVTEAWYTDDATITPTSGANLINLAGGGLNTGYDFGVDASFEIFSVGSTLSFFQGFGGASTPSVQSAVPFTGTRYLESILNSGAGSPQGYAITVLCIPGVTYTFSAYVMIDSGSTTIQMQVENGPQGSILIPFSYVRMSVTFTAQDSIHTILIQTVGTINSGKLRVDSVQFEQGMVSTAFTTYGPTIYGVFKGYVERWPVSWNYSGTYGMSSLTCVDTLAILANQSIYGEIRNETLNQSPAYYWPLDEGQGATYFGEKSDNAGPLLTIINATNGAGTVTPGTTVKITGDPNGQAVQFTNGAIGFNTKGSILRNPWGTPLNVGGSGASWGITLMVNVIVPTGNAGTIAMLANPQAGWFFSLEIDAQANPSLWAKLVTPQGTFTTTTPNNGIFPNIEHICFISISVSGGNTTITCYEFFNSINNSSTTANTTVWGTATPTASFPYLHLGGRVDPYVNYIGPQSTFSHIALWNSALDPTNVMSLLSNMASNGESHEPAGQRIARYLGYSHVVDTFSLDNGVSDMAASSVSGTGDTSVLDAVLAVALSDNGNFYIDENSAAIFQDRDTRYLTTTPGWVFGENAAAGEIPYTGDIGYDYDSTQVYNDVKCTRVTGVTVVNGNGITAVGGAPTDIAASRRRYGTKSLARDLNIESDLETQDAANWLFAAHKDPMQRIIQITIEPSSNPASWPAALGIRIGDRVTVRRRTRQFTNFTQVGNFTMSADYFIERIEHSRQPGSWQVTYQMSPAGAVAGLQPWILADPTYGILDQTTRLGY